MSGDMSSYLLSKDKIPEYKLGRNKTNILKDLECIYEKECPWKEDIQTKESLCFYCCFRPTLSIPKLINNELKKQEKIRNKDKRFEEVNDIIIDHKTNLTWQNNGIIICYDWYNALLYCKNVRLNEFTGWRLPTIDELQTIVNYKNRNPATYTIFTCIKSLDYWTSSSLTNCGNYAWQINFEHGKNYTIVKSREANIILVRNYK